MTEETLGPEYGLPDDLLGVFLGRLDLLLGAPGHGAVLALLALLAERRRHRSLTLQEQLRAQCRETIITETQRSRYGAYFYLYNDYFFTKSYV